MSKYGELIDLLKEELKEELAQVGIEQTVEKILEAKMQLVIEALMPAIQTYVVNSLKVEYEEYKQQYPALQKYGGLNPVSDYDTLNLKVVDPHTGQRKLINMSAIPSYIPVIDAAVQHLQSQVDLLRSEVIILQHNQPLNPPQPT